MGEVVTSTNNCFFINHHKNIKIKYVFDFVKKLIFLMVLSKYWEDMVVF